MTAVPWRHALPPVSESARHDKPQRGVLPRRAVLVYSVIRSVVLSTAVMLTALGLLALAAMVSFGLGPLVVVSDSMQPTLPVGSMTLARTVPVDEVRVGDIVTIDRDGQRPLTHRVVAIDTIDGRTALTLRGDANSLNDSRPYTPATVGRYVTHVPHIGAVLMGLQNATGRWAISLIGLCGLLIVAINPQAATRWTRRASVAAASSGR